MPNAEFFASLGILVVERFLPPGVCARLVEELARAAASPARLGDGSVRTTVRSALSLVPPESGRALVERRLLALRPRLEERFKTSLSQLELDFLRYERGGFYGPHADGRARDGRARKVSAVVFLNDGYRGGRLLLHRLLGRRPPWNRCALPAPAAPGALVAFPSRTFHSVEPVLSGRRCTISGWFH